MIVVSDTSVLLNLALAKQEHLLAAMFGTVQVPGAVHREFVRLAGSDGRFHGLTFPQFCLVVDCPKIPPSLANNPRLDPGETEALVLAVDVKAEIVLMDEAAGREVAKSLGLVPVGILGILVRAKQKGLLEEVAPILRHLLVAGRFRVSEGLLRVTLERAGEFPGE